MSGWEKHELKKRDRKKAKKEAAKRKKED